MITLLGPLLLGLFRSKKIDGEYLKYYRNGTIKLSGCYVSGKKDGVWTWWHKNGQKKTEGLYVNGRADGLWTWWHENGQKKTEGHVKPRSLLGLEYEIFPFRDVVRVIYSPWGAPDGRWNSWNKNGQTDSSLQLINGTIVGYVTNEKIVKTILNNPFLGITRTFFYFGFLFFTIFVSESWKSFFYTGEHDIFTLLLGTLFICAIIQSVIDITIAILDKARSGLSLFSWFRIYWGVVVRWTIMVSVLFVYYQFIPPENGKYSLPLLGDDEFHFKEEAVERLVRYHENGQKKNEEHYANGERDGLLTHWHENGQKKSEEHYKNDKQEGLETTWYDNGQKRWEGNYKDGKLEGHWTYWYENGEKGSETHYKNDEQDGLWTEWYENGQKKSETNFKNGKLVSMSSWKPDGKLSPLPKIVDGSGVMVRWYDNGQKFTETHYKNGERDGLFTVWYENGQKSAEGHSKDGKQDGLLTVWDENGNKTREIQYKDGKIISRKEF